MIDPDGVTPVLSDEAMRDLGFTDHREGFWYFVDRVGGGVSLNFTIEKNTGEYEELVMSELFGQPEYYRNMMPEFRDAIQARIDRIIAKLNAAGLTLAVDPDLYGFDHSPEKEASE